MKIVKRVFTILVITSVSIFTLNGLGQNRKNGAYNEKDVSWVNAANERIEKHRKAPLTIYVHGDNIENGHVEINQLSHYFPIGTALSAKQLMDLDAFGAEYRDTFLTYFNAAVFENDMKWPNWHERLFRGSYSIPQTMAALEFLHANNKSVRGHYLFWNPHRAIDAFRGRISEETFNDPTSFQKQLITNSLEVVRNTDGYVNEWDAINHPVTRNQTSQLEKDGKKILLTDLFGERFLEEFLDTLTASFSKKTWYTNESHILTRSALKHANYLDFCKRLLGKGANLGGIGFMSHFQSTNLPTIQTVYDKFEEYSALGIPLKITEFDVLFGKQGEKYSLSETELQLQKRFTEDFMRICFSHPAIDGFILWGFWENRHWYPSAALWDKDWNIKPNGQAFLDLFYKEWWTQESGQLDTNEAFKTRGFLGDYQINVYNEKKQLVYSNTHSLTKEGLEVVVSIE